MNTLRTTARWLGCIAVLAVCGCEPHNQVVTQPTVVADTNPVKYPLTMWDARVEGETVLLVHVNEHGDVDSTRVDRSSGHAEFDSAASEGARKLRFTPGRRGEKYVAMWTRIPVRFSLDSTATIGIPVSPDVTQ
jgi:TonB family protein